MLGSPPPPHQKVQLDTCFAKIPTIISGKHAAICDQMVLNNVPTGAPAWCSRVRDSVTHSALKLPRLSCPEAGDPQVGAQPSWRAGGNGRPPLRTVGGRVPGPVATRVLTGAWCAVGESYLVELFFG